MILVSRRVTCDPHLGYVIYVFGSQKRLSYVYPRFGARVWRDEFSLRTICVFNCLILKNFASAYQIRIKHHLTLKNVYLLSLYHIIENKTRCIATVGILLYPICPSRTKVQLALHQLFLFIQHLSSLKTYNKNHLYDRRCT